MKTVLATVPRESTYVTSRIRALRVMPSVAQEKLPVSSLIARCLRLPPRQRTRWMRLAPSLVMAAGRELRYFLFLLPRARLPPVWRRLCMPSRERPILPARTLDSRSAASSRFSIDCLCCSPRLSTLPPPTVRAQVCLLFPPLPLVTIYPHTYHLRRSFAYPNRALSSTQCGTEIWDRDPRQGVDGEPARVVAAGRAPIII